MWRNRDGGGRPSTCREGSTIPLARLSSDRWHHELIPGLSWVSPSTPPSRMSPGPPWQIWRAMWPSQHPRGGSQSRHVAFTFCAGGLSGLSLASVGVRAETSARLGTETPANCLYFQTHRPSSLMLVNCTSQAFSNILLDGWHRQADCGSKDGQVAELGGFRRFALLL